MPTDRRGFTLIELMIVIVVIGILAAIAVPNYVRMMDRAREGSTKSNLHTLQIAAEDYGLQNDGQYAATMDASHVANGLPPNFTNPFTGATGSGAAWEDRASLAAPASATSGISSYSDSMSTQYNVKGYGKSIALSLVLTSGQ
jgi:prepilin-type N-terminal cleavage/methylation domain-containing protein